MYLKIKHKVQQATLARQLYFYYVMTWLGYMFSPASLLYFTHLFGDNFFLLVFISLNQVFLCSGSGEQWSQYEQRVFRSSFIECSQITIPDTKFWGFCLEMILFYFSQFQLSIPLWIAKYQFKVFIFIFRCAIWVFSNVKRVLKYTKQKWSNPSSQCKTCGYRN